MKNLFKKLDKILGILILACAVAGGIYIGFFNPTALKPSYTVSLNSEGVTIEQDSFSAKKGSTITLPEPTKEGYIFDGWYNGEKKWAPEDTISGDLELKAKWIPTKHTITFVIDGVEYDQLCDYDSVPTYNGTPLKAPTADKEYSFTGWTPEPSPVKGTATYTATFSESVRKFNISATTSHSSAGTITGTGKYEYGANATISLEVNNGYNFLGWYKNGSFFSSETQISFTNITEDSLLEAQFSIIQRTITYNNIHSTAVNPTLYDITFGEIQLLPQYRNGYEFIGWFTQADGLGSQVTTIDCSLLQDYTLFAHYEIKTFTITYNLDGGTTTPENPTSYKITDSTFTLNNPTKENYTFLGWTGTGLSTITKEVTISNGSYGDREFTALWQPLFVEISFSVDGLLLNNDTISINRGTSISSPTINPTNYGMSGYSISGWYSDPTCTTPFDFSTSIKSSTTLYGQWNYILDNGFYSYLSRFESAVESKTLNILSTDTEDVLIKWIEYISFHNITNTNVITLSFVDGYIISDTNETAFKEKVNALISKSTFPSEHNIGYSYSKSGGVYKLSYLYCGTDDGVINGSLVSDPTKSSTLTQLDNGLLKQSSGRPIDNTSFNINNVHDSLNVTTTNQLVYALEKGLKPVCVADSPAETIYNQAKTILNQIISNDMTDLEKTRAIYDWLIQNVNYDHNAVSDSTISNSWENYNSWYAEGVFNNGVAVCDGYAKAFIILAKTENIPIIRVTGNNHAWNRVYLNGNWYGVDATHGDVAVGSYEVHTYTSFLFTDEQKAQNGYTTIDYSSAQATTTYNYYDNEEYTIASTTIDLLIDSNEEFNLLMDYLSGYTYDSPYFTIEISIDSTFYATITASFGDKVYGLFYNPDSTHSFNLSSYSPHDTDVFGNYVYTLLIN